MRLAAVAALVIPLAGCKLSYPIPRDDVEAWTTRFYETTAEYAEAAPPERFAFTGHMAGHLSAYPNRLCQADP